MLIPISATFAGATALGVGYVLSRYLRPFNERGTADIIAVWLFILTVGMVASFLAFGWTFVAFYLMGVR